MKKKLKDLADGKVGIHAMDKIEKKVPEIDLGDEKYQFIHRNSFKELQDNDQSKIGFFRLFTENIDKIEYSGSNVSNLITAQANERKFVEKLFYKSITKSKYKVVEI